MQFGFSVKNGNRPLGRDFSSAFTFAGEKEGETGGGLGEFPNNRQSSNCNCSGGRWKAGGYLSSYREGIKKIAVTAKVILFD